MAFLTVAASGSGQEAAVTTSHSVAVPASPAAGNVLLVIIHTTGISITVTPPTGFETVGTPNRHTPQGQWQSTAGPWVFAKRSNGTETTPAVFTTPSTQRSTHVWLELNNVAEDMLFGGIAITSASSTGANPNPPANALPTTYGWNDSDVFYLAVTAWTTSNITFTSHPSTYTGIASEKVTSQATGIAVARKDVAALSEDPGTFALSGNSAWVALTIAIRNADNPIYPTAVTQLLGEVGYAADTKNVDITQWLSEVGYSADDKTTDITQFLVEVAYVPFYGARVPLSVLGTASFEPDITTEATGTETLVPVVELGIETFEPTAAAGFIGSVTVSPVTPPLELTSFAPTMPFTVPVNELGVATFAPFATQGLVGSVTVTPVTPPLDLNPYPPSIVTTTVVGLAGLGITGFIPTATEGLVGSVTVTPVTPPLGVNTFSPRVTNGSPPADDDCCCCCWNMTVTVSVRFSSRDSVR